MTKFTLHNSCFAALRANAPEAGAIRAIVNAHGTEDNEVAIVALADSFSPAQSFEEFGAGLATLGLAKLHLLPPMAYFDLAFAELSLRGTEELEDIEREIHSILFPNLPYAWKDFAKANEIDAKSPPPDSASPAHLWRQAKCDVQSLLMHIENERHVLVTLDDNIHRSIKKRQLCNLGAMAIEYPAQAAMMLI